MKINTKVLNIPPYISTSWTNVSSLYVEPQNGQLVLNVELTGGSRIEIPGLEPLIIEAIFAAHAKFLELDSPKTPIKSPEFNLEAIMGDAVQGGIGFALSSGNPGIENFGAMLQHSSEQSDSPDLPSEVLNKIATISKSMGINDPNILPKAEPHCNCMHCQIARAIHGGITEDTSTDQKSSDEEEVSDEDLKFRTWDISQKGEHLYLVSNPLDAKEHYNVYLGSPVGCTCGEKNCEHIRAVLNS